MKPKPANCIQNSVMTAGSGREDLDEVSLDKAYEMVGLLITESRLPDKTLKGRRDGHHIPQNVCNLHSNCSDDTEECQKVKRYKDTMAGLSRNDIPLCIEVLLCPDCELKSQSNDDIGGDNDDDRDNMLNSSVTHDVGTGHSQPSVLLEQWTIQKASIKADSKSQSLQGLCNAVRSHLCFSQLSAWLQASHGSSPKHIFYRLTAPGEWFVHKFVMSPQRHTFPDATIRQGRSALRVSLSSLPRTTMTPYEISLANRDQLFAVRTASPVVQRSNRSQTSLGKTEDKPVYNTETGISLTPKERMHTRSKSVRGMQDFTERKLPIDTHGPSEKLEAQRCLKYFDENVDVHKTQPEMERLMGNGASNDQNKLSAEKLASFSALPTNDLNKLKLISCNSGNPPRTAPPNRLMICPQKAKSLKSPKVLFTRTTHNSNNFFTIPSLNNIANLNLSDDQTSQLCTEIDSDADLEPDTDCDTRRPKFDIMCCDSEVQSEAARIGNIPKAENGSNGIPHEVDKTNQSKKKLSLNSRDGKDSSISSKNSNGTLSHNHENGTELENRCNKPSNKQLNQVRHHPAFHQFTRSRLFKQLPSQSSPAPVKKIGRTNFGYDDSLNNVKAIKSAISCSSLIACDEKSRSEGTHLSLSSSAPTLSSAHKHQSSIQTHSSLLGNFEESLLNGRIDPAGVIEGFTVDIGASGSFCPKHVTLPVSAYFFNSLSDDDAPSPYLGYVDLTQVSRRGYQIPRKGTLQITLFYPNHKVNKMFVVTYDLSDMPARSQTFLRQKTVYAPCQGQICETNKDTSPELSKKLPTYLRYLIHLRFRSTKTDKIYLHTDIRLIYARDKFEFDLRVASYELRSYIESPSNPKYSPLR